METFEEVLAASDAGATDLEIAEQLPTELVAKLVGVYLSIRRRGRVRTIERKVSARQLESLSGDHVRPRLSKQEGSVVAPVSPRAEIERMSVEAFPGVNGRMVTWAAATVEDHEARIAGLRSLIVGTQSTIDRHAAAIKAIRDREATCLADLLVEA